MSDLVPFCIGLIGGVLVAAAIFVARARVVRRQLRAAETDLATGRDKVRRLETELTAAQARSEASAAEIAAGDAELRRRMDELADALLSKG